MNQGQLLTFLRHYQKEGLLRKLENQNEGYVDFCSNDYLGFARSSAIYEDFLNQLKEYDPVLKLGSTGSRLISGNLPLFEKLEQEISEFHRAPAGLIFNSGYNANIGIFASVPKRGDAIIYDALSHASIRDGIRLSFADSYSFKHNDIQDLEKKLNKFKEIRGSLYVSVESIYSMDGDFVPLYEVAELCKKHGAYLIVDEAHSNGIIGEHGEGLVCHLQLENDVFARVHTFGKALGCHGAIVLGSTLLRKFLVSKARSFIYTTALSNHDLLAIYCCYEYLKKNFQVIHRLDQNIALFKSSLPESLRKYFLKSDSPIQSFVPGATKRVKEMEQNIKAGENHVKAILYPTVPKGKERIRICIHSFNTRDEIVKLQRLMARSLGT